MIESGDEVTVLTASHCADSVIGTLRPYEMAQTVVLMNGGNLSGLVTDELEPNRSKRRIKILEADEAIATELSKRYAGNRVSVSMVKTNIMSALLAKRLGAKRSIVLLETQAYAALVQGTDIDVTVSPTQASLGELLRHIRYGDVVNAQELYRGSSEALEIIAHGSKKSSKVVGKQLQEIAFPQGVSVGAIVRGEGEDAKILMAEPDLTVVAEDHLILFIPNKKMIPRIEQLFAVDVGFF